MFSQQKFSLIVNSFSVYAAYPILFFSNLGISVIIAKNLSTTGLGEYKILTSIITGITCIGSLGLDQTLLRYGSQLISSNNYNYLLKFVRILVIIRFFAIMLSWLFVYLLNYYGIMNNILLNYSTYVFLILVISLFQSSNTLIGNTLLAVKSQQVLASIYEIFYSLLKLSAFWLIFSNTTFGDVNKLLSIWAILEIGSIFIFSPFLFKKINTKLPIIKHQLKGIGQFSFFAYMSILFNFFRDSSSDLILLSAYVSKSAVGIYSVAFLLSNSILSLNPASILRNVLTAKLTNYIYQTNNENIYIIFYNLLCKLVILFLLPLFIIITPISNNILRYVFGQDFVDGYRCVLILSSFFSLSALIYPFAPIINTIGKNHLFLVNSFFSLYNLILNIFLIPKFGIIGTAISTGSAGALQFFTYHIIFSVFLKYKINFALWPYLKILLFSIPLILLIFFINSHINNLFQLIILSIFGLSAAYSIAFFGLKFNHNEKAIIHSLFKGKR